MRVLLELDGEGAHSADGRLGRAASLLSSCVVLLGKLASTSSEPTPEALTCFDPSINRQLLVPGPPRSVEPNRDPKVCLKLWGNHLEALQESVTGSQSSLSQLLGLASTHREEPNVLPRSVAQQCLSETGVVRRMLLDSLEDHLFPQEALQHCGKPAKAFLDRCVSVCEHLTRLSHANRARRFRRLAHVFQDLNVLQHDAWKLDELLKTTFGANLRHP